MKGPAAQKAKNNLAVCLEKLGKRKEALEILTKETQSVGIANNLAVVNKREKWPHSDLLDVAEKLATDKSRFYTIYNQAVSIA